MGMTEIMGGMEGKGKGRALFSPSNSFRKDVMEKVAKKRGTSTPCY